VLTRHHTCVAVCCSVLQRLAVRRSALQCVAVYKSLSNVFLRHGTTPLGPFLCGMTPSYDMNELPLFAAKNTYTYAIILQHTRQHTLQHTLPLRIPTHMKRNLRTHAHQKRPTNMKRDLQTCAPYLNVQRGTLRLSLKKKPVAYEKRPAETYRYKKRPSDSVIIPAHATLHSAPVP